MRFLFALCLFTCFAHGSFGLEAPNQALLDHARACPRTSASNVPNLVAWLRKKASSEKQLAEVFCYWIAENIAYDTEAFFDRQDVPLSTVLAERKGICQDYAELLQQLCRSVGIECYVIGGYAKANGFQKNTRFTAADHAWNVLKVDGKYMHVDVTWASGYVENRQGTLVFRKALDVSEILADPDDFAVRHLPADPRWQLRSRPITMSGFENNDSVSDMIKQPAAYYNFADSIAAYVKNDSIQQVVLEAESAYRFNPIKGNLSRLADAYYSKGWYLAVTYPDAQHYRLSIGAYEKAIDHYTRLNNSYGARWIAAARKSIRYMTAQLNNP